MEKLNITSADGTALALRRWSPAGPPAGEVLLVHGLAEHCGRYEHVAAALVRAGLRTTFVALRGHGASGGRRGHVDRWGQYEEDLRAAAATIEGPFSIVAHSMGGLVTLSALEAGLDREITGLALSNPLLGVAVQAPAIKVKAAVLLSKLLPRLPLSNELDVQDISRDPEVVRAYRSDPEVYATITPRWYTECLAAQRRVLAAAPSYTRPLLMLLGTGDRICDHAAAAAFAERYGAGDKRTVVFDGYYHELFNEPEKDAVLAEVTGWLRRRDGEAAGG